MTKYLRGENDNVFASKSNGIPINFDTEAIQTFEKLKNILCSDDVLLYYSDYSKVFELTTDTSISALGAVLLQGNRHITMISRTLSKTEENYPTNERELLAIVWALKHSLFFLTLSEKIQIFCC